MKKEKGRVNNRLWKYTTCKHSGKVVEVKNNIEGNLDAELFSWNEMLKPFGMKKGSCVLFFTGRHSLVASQFSQFSRNLISSVNYYCIFASNYHLSSELVISAGSIVCGINFNSLSCSLMVSTSRLLDMTCTMIKKTMNMMKAMRILSPISLTFCGTWTCDKVISHDVLISISLKRVKCFMWLR